MAKNTWEKRFKTQKWERRKWGGEKISTDSFSLVHRFLLLFWLVKNSILFFFNIWTKNVFPHFSANDCDLILHIMLALGYYHSMMLRGDQSLLRGHDYSTETTSCWHAPRPLYNSRVLKGRSKVGTGVLFYLFWSSSPMSDIQIDSLLATVSPSFSFEMGNRTFQTQGAFMVGDSFVQLFVSFDLWYTTGKLKLCLL